MDSNVLRRKLQARIQGSNALVIPGLYLSQEYPAQGIAIQLELAGPDSFDIYDGNHASNNGRELQELLLVQLVLCQRSVRSAKIHGPRHDLALSASRTYGLVIDLIFRSLMVAVRP